MTRIDAAVIAFSITLLFLLALRPVAVAIGLVDRPGGRKQHVGVVPVIGGIAMFIGLAAVLPLVKPSAWGITPFLIAAGLLLVVGAIDDRFDLAPMVRLVAQACAGLILCLGAGLTVQHLGDILFLGTIPLGFLALPFTVLVTISVINAFNMLDGMDGLAAGIAVAVIAATALASLIFGTGTGLTLAVVSLAVALAFLLVNFPARFNRPVRTFMGDAGSTLLGFIVVWLGLRLVHGPEPVISPVTALWIAALPIFDLFISFGRRLSKGESPLSPDREHFHHILQRAGLGDREIVIVMGVAAFVMALTGIAAHRLGAPDGMLFFGLIFIGWLQYLAVRRAWRMARWIKRRRRQLLARE